MTKTKLSPNQIKTINEEYLTIVKFNKNALSDLAAKYGITVDELLDIIEL
jgi:hypothetical protein